MHLHLLVHSKPVLLFLQMSVYLYILPSYQDHILPDDGGHPSGNLGVLGGPIDSSLGLGDEGDRGGLRRGGDLKAHGGGRGGVRKEKISWEDFYLYFDDF